MTTLFFNLSIFVALILLVASNNILLSVLLLVLIALLFSLYIIGLSSIFVGLLYLAIYVGAVTVFILFVVMMTDLSLSSEAYAADQGRLNQSATKKLEPNSLVTGLVVAFFFVSYFCPKLEHAVALYSRASGRIARSFVYDTPKIVAPDFVINDESKIRVRNFFNQFDLITNSTDDTYTTQIAFDLMNQHMAPFLILGLIILLSLIGSIFIVTQGTRKPLPSIGLSAHFEASTGRQGCFKSQDMDLQLVVDSMNTLTLNSSQNL